MPVSPNSACVVRHFTGMVRSLYKCLIERLKIIRTQEQITMRRKSALLFVFVFIVPLTLTCSAEKPLRSPWDSLKVKVTDAPYTFSLHIHLTHDDPNDSFYSD